MEIGTLAIGCYGLAKGGIELVQVPRLSHQGAKTGGRIAAQEVKYIVSIGAENVNAGINLSRKLSGLQAAQAQSSKIRLLVDGRTRYYDPIRKAKTSGSNIGASYVTEYSPKTGRVRSWNECYDQFGNVNRVHPKTINGQVVQAMHYPPILTELVP